MGGRGGMPNGRMMTNVDHISNGMNGHGFYPQQMGSLSMNEMPLRMLVPSEMVGAIIGKGGTTIKQITHHSHARVDVHKKDTAAIFSEGQIEKVIQVYGTTEQCAMACAKILEVIQKEQEEGAADSNGAGAQKSFDPLSLKLLAHNNFIGRLIGKDGFIIRKIMDETNTKISVTNGCDNRERVIIIKGSIDEMSKAQFQITQKMRKSYENDLHQMQMMTAYAGANGHSSMGHTVMSHGATGYHQPTFQRHPVPQHPLHGYHSPRDGNFQQGPYYPPYSSAGLPPSTAFPRGDGSPETAHVWVPAFKVGAIIGTRGVSIREIIKTSGCDIKVAPTIPKSEPQPKTSEDSKDGSDKEESAENSESSSEVSRNTPPTPATPSDSRRVTLKGTPDSQWTAQSCLFHKVFRENPLQYTPHEHLDPLMRAGHLKVEISIPSGQVGRLIGRNGQTVKELQRSTHARIKLPDNMTKDQTANADPSAETPVYIIGDFFAVQAAQRQIRALVARCYNGKATPPSAANAKRMEDVAVAKTQKVEGECNTSESQC